MNSTLFRLFFKNFCLNILNPKIYTHRFRCNELKLDHSMWRAQIAIFILCRHTRSEWKKIIRKNLLHCWNFPNFEYGRFFPGSFFFVLVNVRFVGFYYIITHQHKQIIRNGANTQHTNTNAMNNNKIHEIKRMYLISNIIFCWIFLFGCSLFFRAKKVFVATFFHAW